MTDKIKPPLTRKREPRTMTPEDLEPDTIVGDEVEAGLFGCGEADTSAPGTIRQYSDGREFTKIEVEGRKLWKQARRGQ